MDGDHAGAGAIETKRGTCPVCAVGCFVEAKTQDNRVVAFRPDRKSGFPADCPRAGQAREYHDHPDRINYPMKRVGKRGEGKWERIGWEQALDEIAAKLRELRERHGPETVQVTGGSYKGAGDTSGWRWNNLWGSPNILYQGKNCGEAELLAEWAVYGNQASIGSGKPIPGTSKCVIYWGHNPIRVRLLNKKEIHELQQSGCKVIAIDPRRTELTDVADIWLRIRPGTDGALAYGMLNVIIREKIYDAAFVEKWCEGFDELAEIVRPFTPEKVAEITWIPAEKIVEVARIFATSGPAHIPFGLGVATLGRGSTSAVFGRSYLRAITGNLDIEGGAKFGDMPDLIRLREEMHWDKLLNHPERTRDNISAHVWPVASVRGMKAYREAMAKVHPLGIGPAIYQMVVAPSSIWKAIIDADPYPVKALINQGGNIMVALGDTRRIHEALMSDNLELSVNMDHWMTPAGLLADYVFPATDGFERPLLSNMWGFANTFSAAERTVQPLYERRDDYQLWRELGNRLGQDGMWPDTLEEWFDDMLKPTGMTHQQMSRKESPWLMPEPKYKRYEDKGFATASGKVELSSRLMKRLGYPAIPDYEEPTWSPSDAKLSKDFPLILITGSGLKWYYRSQQRQLEKMRKQHPYAQLSLHPDTAAELGIKEYDLVWVETPLGRVRQEARFDDSMHPRVVHADSHMWYPERKGEDGELFGVWESNISVILPDDVQYSDYSGNCYLRGLMCKVERVGENKRPAVLGEAAE